MIKSVKKAVGILLLLANYPEQALSLSKISAELALNKTTCAHILDTLCDSLLVERVSRKDGYRLGAGTYMLTRYGRYQESLIEVCSPVIKWLNKRLDATVFLTVVCDGVKYIVFHVDSDERIDFRHSEIIQGNIEVTATGMLMMAYMDSELLSRVIYRRTEIDTCYRSPEEEKKFTERFSRIRKDGYAYVHNESECRQSYAFRICDGKRTVASIGVLYPDCKDSEEFRSNIIKNANIAVNEINRRLMFKEEKAMEGSQF